MNDATKPVRYRKARSIRDIAKDPRVEEVWGEGENGYWVRLKSPWWSTQGTTQVHEYTVKDLVSDFNDIAEGPTHP